MVVVALLLGAQSASAQPRYLSLFDAQQATYEDEKSYGPSLVEGYETYAITPSCVAHGNFRAACRAEVTGRTYEFDSEGRESYFYKRCKWTVKVRSTHFYLSLRTKRRGLACREWMSTSPLESY